ncbi:MAG: aspartyl/asparaginyl beta-hydroxylase domain-containing protein [Halieaceae bacterium]|nr:aspartyl/asparaginyl beta-hydroxylase domain-containing protein [Halieaceae bacterium]
MSSTNQSVPQALISNAIAALQRGDGQGALAQLHEAERQYPGDASIKLNRAMVHRNLGDLPASVQALDAALAIEPYYFLALISKGAVLEQMGHIRHAAKVYGDALRIAPPMEQAPPALQQQLRKARELVDTQSTQLRDHLRERLGELLGRTSGEALGRVNEAVDLMAGVQPEVYHSRSIQLQVPRLPAIPFFERDYFPWLPTLEAATDVIRSELVALLEEGMPGFAPYIQYAAGTPENQFAELNHNERWSSLWLWKDGVAQEEPMARCPETTAVLSELPLADQPGFAPTALFSALAPHTRIPPHTGSTNSRLLVHLPLVLPGPAGFRVGSETREWEIGHAWAFDDTIEHEAWNDADETRVIMIFDIWNPLLSAEERDLVSALLREHSDWMSSQPA